LLLTLIPRVLNLLSSHFSRNRWGRIGESGQNKMHGPFAEVENGEVHIGTPHCHLTQMPCRTLLASHLTVLPANGTTTAMKEFNGKFKAKTGTAWDNRSSIVPKIGKYAPVDMADDDEDGDGDVAMTAVVR
jgi:hypothetical protein